MKSPYDTALRLAERRLDAVRRQIGAAIEELQRIDAACVEAERRLERESLLAATDPHLATERFFLSARDHRVALMGERDMTHARLESLRRKSVECYGEQQAIDGALARWSQEAARAADAADQAAIDDLAATRFLRHRGTKARAARMALPPAR